MSNSYVKELLIYNVNSFSVYLVLQKNIYPYLSSKMEDYTQNGRIIMVTVADIKVHC